MALSFGGLPLVLLATADRLRRKAGPVQSWAALGSGVRAGTHISQKGSVGVGAGAVAQCRVCLA